MTTQVEVKLGRVGDFRVHGRPCWNVSALPHLQQHRSPLDTPRGQEGKASKQARRGHTALCSEVFKLANTLAQCYGVTI